MQSHHALIAPWIGTRHAAEAFPEFAGEESVVAKAGCEGDLVQRRPFAHLRTMMQQAHSVVEAKRVDDLNAARPSPREQLLQVAQGYPRLGGHFRWREIRV